MTELRTLMAIEGVMQEQTQFVKCWDENFKMIVWVQIHNIRSVVNESGVARVWLKEPVPIGVNSTANMLFLFLDYAPRTAGLAQIALPPQT